MFTEFLTHAPADEFWLWAGSVTLIAIGGFIATFVFIHRARIIEDTPTSKIRSAAQGYLELEGTAEMMPGPEIEAPLTRTPCVWFSYLVERYVGGKNDKWRTIDKGTSDGLFWLNDGTGKCAVDPDGATVTATVNHVWYGRTERPILGPPARRPFIQFYTTGSYRYTEKRIHAGDPLYAIGQFQTLGGVNDVGDKSSEVRELLRDWKRDQRSLLARFDRNKDGKIDTSEWDNARRAAERQVTSELQERHSQPGIDTLTATGDRLRPFLLSAVPQRRLVQRYRRYSQSALTAFFVAGAMAVWMIGLRLT